MTDLETSPVALVWDGRHLFRVAGKQRFYTGSVILSAFTSPGLWMVWVKGRCRATCQTEEEARRRLENLA